MDLSPRSLPKASADTLRGLLAPSILIKFSDGKVENAELREIIGAIRFNPYLRSFDPETLSMLVEEMSTVGMGLKAVEELSVMAEALTPELRETAIAMALRIAVADGTLRDAEHKALVMLAMRLDIDPEQYNKMVEVVTILQRAA